MSQGLNVVILFLLNFPMSFSFPGSILSFLKIRLKTRQRSTTRRLQQLTLEIERTEREKVKDAAGATTPKEAIFQYYIYTVTQYKYKIYIAVSIIHKIMIDTM